jgi:flagellar hook-basal body complex protein FliE
VLKQAIGSVSDMGHKSDAQARAEATGKANMVDVVTAVSQTEVAIDAVVAVRDKIIAAYEDIMKMPI